MNSQCLLVIGLLILLFMAGCRSDIMESGADNSAVRQGPAAEPAAPEPSASPTSTPEPTNTPTPIPTATSTPSPTPTPTPTAIPISIMGDPRAALEQEAQRHEQIGCGIVDFLDFPLDPPDALEVAYGGQGFGRFRGRYDQYHAGEDWQLNRGRSNLGVPVYAIGHGRVAYAQPLGWGRDQGVIIVRHTFDDGSTVLSFYGHMDPDSVTLRAGECVERGQKIAEIGQPRTPPHLHFEIRTHMPDEPGPGYWPVDPREAGWLPPSQFIWNNRMASIPGAAWTRQFPIEDRKYIGLANGSTVIALEDGMLVGINAADGRLEWRIDAGERAASAALDSDGTTLYVADWSGLITAYPLLAGDESSASSIGEPLWQSDSKMTGAPALLPAPGGGIAASVRDRLSFVSAAGELLWEEELEQRLFDWLLTGDRLILTVTGSEGPIYSVTAEGLQSWPISLSGRPIEVGEDLWLYSSEGLYRLDPVEMAAELLYLLPPSFFQLGSAVALPEGGALIAHREQDESRLIAFYPDGSLRWERSYADLGWGEQRLLVHNNKPYLLLQSGSGSNRELKLYAVDIENSTVKHIFTGGTRTSMPGGPWFESINSDLLLINVGGGSMAALNPAEAEVFLDSLTIN